VNHLIGKKAIILELDNGKGFEVGDMVEIVRNNTSGGIDRIKFIDTDNGQRHGFCEVNHLQIIDEPAPLIDELSPFFEEPTEGYIFVETDEFKIEGLIDDVVKFLKVIREAK
jgi:hypothetical protein